jgi:hypothetical protein
MRPAAQHQQGQYLKPFMASSTSHLAQDGSRHSACDLRRSVGIRSLVRHDARALAYVP